jgi:acyl-CoA synthetase (AMP-forming)/AMP-acid ligase II
VERVLARLEARAAGPLAVLDPTWPAALRQRSLADLAAASDARRVTSDDLVLFTSGSSGSPRAVVRTCESWRASLRPLSDVLALGPAAEAGPVWVPGALTSSLFLYGAVHAAWSGLTWARGQPDSPDIQGVTSAHLVPAQLADALDARDQGLLPRLRTVAVAGAHLPAAVRERATRQAIRVVEYYGAAELSFVGWRDDDGPFRPFPGAEVHLDHPARAAGRPGDGPHTAERPGGRAAHPLDAAAVPLWVRSPYVARGYLDPGVPGPWVQRDGWHSVGDLARASGEGWHLLGRGDATVTTGGHTVVAEEVEAALRAVPGVADVVVVGLAHARLGEVVAAVVRATSPGEEGLRDRLGRAARALPSPSRPRRWLAADELPRLPSGKVDRAAVRNRAETMRPL